MTETISVPVDFNRVIPWRDPHVDQYGVAATSAYVEQFWLSALGPSSTWLLRKLAEGFHASPNGYLVDVTELAYAIGLGNSATKNSMFMRALSRLAFFDFIRTEDAHTIAVREFVPRIRYHHLARLPQRQRLAHDLFAEKFFSQKQTCPAD